MVYRRPLVLGLFLMTAPFTFAGDVGDPHVPYVAAPLAATPPVVDGQIRAEEWASASGVSGLVDITRGSVAAQQPQTWVMWDTEALYVAARLPLPGGMRPRTKVAQRDGQVWEDDAVEIFLDPAHSHRDYFQLIVNAAGAQWDSRRQDPSWDADWQAKTGVLTDCWEVELRIPFASLGLFAPSPQTLWGFNVCWDRRTPEPLNASWAHVNKSFHDPAHFGHLCFAEVSTAVQLVGPTRPTLGKVVFAGTWWGAVPSEATLTVSRREGEGFSPVGTATAKQAGAKTPTALRLEVDLPTAGRLTAEGEYQVDLTVADVGSVVYRSIAPLVVPPPLQVTVRKYWLSGKVEVEVDASGLGLSTREATVTAALLDARGRQLHARRLNPVGEIPAGTILFVTDRLRPGDYQVLVAATDRRGRVLKRVILPLSKPSLPSWVGSREGISDQVLAPWTAVEVSQQTVSVWGRQYVFGELPFPAEVRTAQASILAGPITLELNAGGKPLRWEAERELQVASWAPNAAVLKTSARAGGVQCRGKVTVEYDGMIRSDFTVIPSRGVRIEGLSLVIPIKEQHARYLYHYPGRWGSAYNAGALPSEGFIAGFRPFIWLGDEDRGLAWFSESDRNFVVKDPNRVTEITRADGVVRLRIHLVAGSEAQSGPLEYTFGFQATPVKPLEPDVWDYRICHHGNYGIERQPWRNPGAVRYPAEGHIRLDQGTFEAWVRPRFNPQPDVARDDPGRGAFNRSLFDVEFPNGDRIGFYWNIDDRGMRVYYKQGETYPVVQGARAEWQAGEWHHVALTWGDKTRIFLDGQLVVEVDHKGTLGQDLKGAGLILGAGFGGPSEFDIDEVRISDIPRESFDLSAPPMVDEHTLLLDRFDQPLANVSERPTSPEKGAPGLARMGKTVDGRFGNAFSSAEEASGMTLLDRLAELGVRTLCFHEHWTDIQNYTSTTHGEQLRSLVQACHERGIKLVLYFGYEMSNIAPEWDLYSDECLVYPRAGGYQRLPEQTAYIVCYRSKWQDFLADGIARLMDEYDIDGVYLDGTANPWGCANEHHGCGYRRADGSLGTTYTFFATRDMMRRIYTIVKSRKPDGIVNVHQSTCMTIPTLAWATSYWDGEQFGGIERGPDPLEVLPLDAFRCEFMGRQWGVPAEFLCYNRPYTMDEALAFTLLHDVLVRGSLGGSLETVSRLWHGMEAFGRRGSVWLPYWNNADYVRLGPDASIKASIYSRGSQGAVVVVSNLSRERKDAQVQLWLYGLALPQALQASDMVTGEVVEISEEGTMTFPLGPFGWRVVWVRPK